MSMLTLGERRALEAVHAGSVVRVYRSGGNILRGKGVSSAALWRLDAAKMIEDGPNAWANLSEPVVNDLQRPASSRCLGQGEDMLRLLPEIWDDVADAVRDALSSGDGRVSTGILRISLPEGGLA